MGKTAYTAVYVFKITPEYIGPQYHQECSLSFFLIFFQTFKIAFCFRAPRQPICQLEKNPFLEDPLKLFSTEKAELQAIYTYLPLKRQPSVQLLRANAL